MELTIAELYAAGVRRNLDLAATLTEADGDVPVPACPGWTVRDVYAHLAGAATDILAGRLEGAPGDEWTARQVAERKGRTLAEVVAELAEKGPAMAKLLEALPDEPRPPIDQWTHEQDVRGALGRPGGRDEPVVAWLLAGSFARLGRRWADKGRPTVRVEGSSGAWLLGDGEPAATLAASDFELARALLGRRSPAQLRAMARPGSDPAAVDAAVAALPFFGPRQDDLVE